MQDTPSYAQLYTRNYPIISPELQKDFRRLRVAVAGCGSTGGAFIDGMIRLGVEKYHLSDTGSYELSNLNRQMVFISDINSHKAETHKKRILNINSQAQVKVWQDGVHHGNLADFLKDIDFLFDAVDVTTQEGMKAKLALHKAAHEMKIPTGSALDLGYTQWLQSYNYHENDPLLLGHFEAARNCQHPLKALLVGWTPVEDLPLEAIHEALRLIANPTEGACQLGCACFALSAMVTPYLYFFIKHGRLPGVSAIDLLDIYSTPEERTARSQQKKEAEVLLRKTLESLA